MNFSNRKTCVGAAFFPQICITVLLIITCALVWRIYLLEKDIRPPDFVLAQIDDEVLTRHTLNPTLQAELKTLKHNYDTLLHTNVGDWIRRTVLLRAAESMNLSVDQYLTQNIPKPRFTDDEVYAYYASSPEATSLNLEEDLTNIRMQLYHTEVARLMDALVLSLAKEADLRVNLETDLSDLLRERVPATYSQYVPTPAFSDLENGRVVGPPTLGATDARVVLEVYADYLCPYSQKFAPVMHTLLAKYPRDLRVEFHDFPLNRNPIAMSSARAARCAQAQGRFWEFHDLHFETLKPREPEDVFALAKTIGLEPSAFERCVNESEYTSLLEHEISRAEALNLNRTPTIFLNGRYLLTPPTIESISEYVDWHLNPEGRYPGARARAPIKAKAVDDSLLITAPSATVEFTRAEFENSLTRGEPDAPLTFVEYSDFHCPYCKQAASTVEYLLSKYGDKIYFVHKQFPMDMHPNARRVSEAAYCAGDQNKFWDFREAVYSDVGRSQTHSGLMEIATELTLDLPTFRSCVDNSTHKARVDRDIASGQSHGVSGTPTFFLNGIRLRGAQPRERFESYIRENLPQS